MGDVKMVQKCNYHSKFMKLGLYGFPFAILLDLKYKFEIKNYKLKMDDVEMVKKYKYHSISMNLILQEFLMTYFSVENQKF